MTCCLMAPSHHLNQRGLIITEIRWYSPGRQFHRKWSKTSTHEMNSNILHIVIRNHTHQEPVPWFNIKMSSYQYMISHCGDKTVIRSSYLHYGISYTGKMSSLYRIRAQRVNWHQNDTGSFYIILLMHQAISMFTGQYQLSSYFTYFYYAPLWVR